MKEFKEAKMKEFEEKFTVMIKPQSFNNQFANGELLTWISQLIDEACHEGYKDGFMKGNEATEETFNRLNKNTYAKAIEDAKKAVDSEPEYPGEPPQEMIEWTGDMRKEIIEVLRTSVALTKTNIKKRLQQLLVGYFFL